VRKSRLVRCRQVTVLLFSWFTADETKWGCSGFRPIMGRSFLSHIRGTRSYGRKYSPADYVGIILIKIASDCNAFCKYEVLSSNSRLFPVRRVAV
jgi:hypothetical protein